MGGVDIPGLQVDVEPLLNHFDDIGVVIDLGGCLAYQPLHPDRSIVLGNRLLIRTASKGERKGNEQHQSD